MATASARPKKSGAKSGARNRTRRPGTFAPGPDARRGRGPDKGAPNAGRPPNEHIEWCRRMVSDPACEKAVESVLKDPHHAAFSTMWREMARRAYGMPTQNVDVKADVTHTHRQEWKLGGRVIAWN